MHTLPRPRGERPYGGARLSNASRPESVAARLAVLDEKHNAARLTCHEIRQRAEDFTLLPPALRIQAWPWLCGSLLEAIDRSIDGCPRCGSLLARPEGGCLVGEEAVS